MQWCYGAVGNKEHRSDIPIALHPTLLHYPKFEENAEKEGVRGRSNKKCKYVFGKSIETSLRYIIPKWEGSKSISENFRTFNHFLQWHPLASNDQFCSHCKQRGEIESNNFHCLLIPVFRNILVHLKMIILWWWVVASPSLSLDIYRQFQQNLCSATALWKNICLCCLCKSNNSNQRQILSILF